MAAFPDGSYVITGSFVGPAVLGAGELNETSFDGVIAPDMFIARYHADGTLDWAREASGTEHDVGRDVAALPDGSCVVVGHFWGDIVFAAGEPNETPITTTGNADLFVARYSPDGDLLWVKTATGPDHEYATAVAAFADGSIVVVGGTGSATFGAGEPNETTLPNSGAGFTTFVARYDPDGSLAWVRWRDGASWALSVAAHANGSSSVGTRFGLARYGGDGSLLWVAEGGVPGSVAALADGGVLCTGSYRDEVTLGAGEPNETTIVGGPLLGAPNRAYFARYEPDGSLRWARPLTTPNFGDSSWRVAVRPNGSFVLAGPFHEMAVFGEGTARETTLAGKDGAFVAGFDEQGRFQWARGVVSETLFVNIESLDLDGNGSILTAGFLMGRVSFDGVPFEGFGPVDPLFMEPLPEGFMARLR